jgi:hypothetical protein
MKTKTFRKDPDGSVKLLAKSVLIRNSDSGLRIRRSVRNIYTETVTVLRIRIRNRIHRIHMFLGLLDPDSHPFIIKQK